MTKPLLLLCLVLATVSACTGEPLSRAGATAEPVTLTAVWGQGPTGIGGDVLRQLIDGTDGAAVTVAEGARPQVGDMREERHGVEVLQAGDADITVVRAGILQELGAGSLAPLGVPFVVTNNDQAAAIAADADLSEQLMSGLDDLGLVGLGLVPGGLRHPFGFGTDPLLGAGDYQGEVINIREDAGVQAILDQLGARADNSVDSERHLAAGKRLRGIEVSVQQFGAVVLPAVQTPNVTLYEKFDVVVVRLDTWDGLTKVQQQDLRASVLAAAQAAADTRATEEEGQAAWCLTTYASSVLATEAQLSTLHTALDPIAARVAGDTDAARSLDRMRELGAGTVDPVPSACVAPAPPEAPEAYYVTPRGDQRVLDGLWRLEVDEQVLLEAGLSRKEAYDNAGVWEFRITNGYADGAQPDGRRCNGEFAMDGREISVDFGVRGVEDCGGLMRGTYELRGDRVFFDWQKELEYDVLLDQAMFAPGMVRIE
jgi:hypothetical protein